MNERGVSEQYLKAKERLAQKYADAAPPLLIESAVMGEFDRAKRLKQRRWLIHLGAVAAAVVIVASVTWQPTPGVAPKKEQPVQEQPFVAIPYVAPLGKYERAEVVRMQLPVSALMAAGLPVRMTDPGLQVVADVLVGQDGRARALRLVEGN
jgi:hypothetical protein